MIKITYITPTFAVAGSLKEEDFEQARALGFKTIISHLPEGEDATDLTPHRAAQHAWHNGLAFRHIPAGKLELFDDAVVDAMEDSIRGLEGPVLAYCRSGMRSSIVWAAAAARNQDIDCVIAALASAGFELDFLRDDFEEQSGRQRNTQTAPALDCSKSGEVVRAEASV